MRRCCYRREAIRMMPRSDVVASRCCSSVIYVAGVVRVERRARQRYHAKMFARCRRLRAIARRCRHVARRERASMLWRLYTGMRGAPLYATAMLRASRYLRGVMLRCCDSLTFFRRYRDLSMIRRHARALLICRAHRLAQRRAMTRRVV